MKRTDYARIADVYDDNEWRLRIDPDAVLGALAGAGGEVDVLDLACGTGNWLVRQRDAHPEERIRFRGIDASPEMLERARDKLGSRAELSEGNAESLPFENDSFDLVACNFAFHHFEDKPTALDEAVRVLRPGGVLRLRNIAPEHMRDWWIYRYFPQTWLEDQKRFWSVELMLHELGRRGLACDARIETVWDRQDPVTLRREAERRDMSQLDILDDAEFEAGMRRLADAVADGGPLLTIMGALLVLTARRPE